MNWRENLRKASFRGVPFFYQGDAKAKAGRRVVIHEYPLRDEVYAEDLGLKQREFTLEAYVIGPDYMAARDALEAACNKEGPGTLVHPTRGELQVVCTGCDVTESTREGGMARFSLVFVVSGENKFPTVAMDNTALVDAKADTAQLAIEQAFNDTFSLDGQPGWVADRSGNLVLKALDGISSAAGNLPGLVTGGLGELTSDIAPYGFSAAGAATSLVSLSGALSMMRSGGLSMLLGQLPFARALFSVMRLFSGSGGSAYGAYQAQSSLWSWGSDLAPVRATTPSRRQEAANQEALVDLVRQASVVEAARVAARVELASYDQAVSLRDPLAARLDEIRMTAPDPVFRTVTDLRSAVVRDVTERGGTLARVTTVRAPDTLPAVVVAHRLFGDATRAEELVSRNRLPHPGFVPGGTDLEVLNA